MSCNLLCYNAECIIQIIFINYQQVNIDSDIEVKLPLNQFKPYYRGKLVPNQPELNIKNITTFGLQVAGGVYNDFKQSGVSSLEINNIIAEL